MALTVWQQIQSAIDTRLRTILITNSYKTNAGSNVFYWRTADFAQDEAGNFAEMPGIKYYETVEKTETISMAIELNTTTLNIECLATGSVDSTVKQILDQMYSDVLKCVGVDETWGGLALLTELKGHEVKLEREEILTGSILAIFEVQYRHKRWDAYTAM